ncbi:MAG TPA: glycerophosphoryl diester phosphodiesterase membrane domain-containing protein [Candidatus Angelobacter sp.]|nr:glycerophosphoryl diester phosphodiesterase membrane domain-containing protein [Candidatus Angelobacter sp.]HXO58222.1 glycerophosphoryl diester phosphodiesterase membrane domain-containing protein [Candidatus Acidoferrum sp.]
MATAGEPVRLRVMPLGELLDESFKLYRRHFTVIAGVALVIILPGLILSLISGSYRANPVTYLQNVAQSFNNPDELARLQAQQRAYTSSPLYLLSFPIAALLLPFSVGALYRAATSLAAGNVETIGSVLSGTLRRYFPVWGVVILAALLFVGVIGIVTIPVVIWVAIRWSVAIPALFAEGIGPLKALGRSWNLVRDNWWRTLGILIIVSIMVYLIDAALQVLFTGVAAVVPGLNGDLRAGVITTITTLVDALVGAITPIAITMLYLDLRVRKEGLDLDQLARQAAPGTAPA